MKGRMIERMKQGWFESKTTVNWIGRRWSHLTEEERDLLDLHGDTLSSLKKEKRLREKIS